MDAKPTVAAAQGKQLDEAPNKGANQKFTEERKENRAALGQQVMNGNANARQESATKRKAPANAANNYGRNTQAAGWANG